MIPLFPLCLHKFFVDKFRDPATWFDARRRFTRSVAVWSMTGYVVVNQKMNEQPLLLVCVIACVRFLLGEFVIIGLKRGEVLRLVSENESECTCLSTRGQLHCRSWRSSRRKHNDRDGYRDMCSRRLCVYVRQGSDPESSRARAVSSNEEHDRCYGRSRPRRVLPTRCRNDSSVSPTEQRTSHVCPGDVPTRSVGRVEQRIALKGKGKCKKWMNKQVTTGNRKRRRKEERKAQSKLLFFLLVGGFGLLGWGFLSPFGYVACSIARVGEFTEHR